MHSANKRTAKRTFGAEDELIGAFLILSVGMCTGALSATIFMLSDELCEFWHDAGASASSFEMIAKLFLSLCWFHVIAYLLGSSFKGFYLLPVLSAVFGFRLYSFSAGAFDLPYDGGFAQYACNFLAPVLLLVPCFFVIAVDAFLSSRGFWLMAYGRSSRADASRRLHFLACIPFMLFAVLTFVFFAS